MAPLVSVIIPVYNAERYIESTIRSVLNQTLQDFEIIVLNDGSKDSSGIVIQRLQQEDKRIIYIPKPNSGVSDTRNIGISKASGKYFAFLDADDLWKPDNLEKKINGLRENGKQWVFSSLEYIDENNKLLPSTLSKFKPYDILDNLLLWEGDVIPGPCSNIVVARELFGDDVKFDTHLSSPADRDICIQLAAKADPLFIDEKLWQYRLHSQSMTNVNMKVADEVIFFIDKVKKKNLFSGNKIRKKSLSNLYLMLAGICYSFTGHKLQGIKYLFRSFLYSPGNVWKKKIRPAFNFIKK
jgi:glycosyltransferase involved in cell wall biosynthesis